MKPILECRCTCHCHFQTADKELLEDNPDINKCHNEVDVTNRHFPDFCKYCNEYCIE